MDKPDHKYLPKLTVLLLFCVAVLVVKDVLTALFDQDAASIRVYEDAFRAIRHRHVKAVEATDLLYTSVRAMVQSLKDPHSEFLPPPAQKQLEEAQSGKSAEFVGVGVELEVKDKQIIVVAPIEGTPAHKAGIQPRDIIVEVDGQKIEGLSSKELVVKIRGPKGTQVTLGIQRPGHDGLLSFTLTREKIEVPHVRSDMLEGKIGRLRISSFPSTTSDKVAQEIKKLRAKQLAALVIDLRFNPGGYLDEAVKVADQFLSEGVIVSVKGRQKREDKVYKAKKDGTLPDFPVVVLVDRGTASASEVLTAALQENGRAKVVGTETFGKGVVGRDFPLADGSGLMLTVAEYHTPKGHMIEKKGIQPDVNSDGPPDVQLEEAVKLLREALTAR